MGDGTLGLSKSILVPVGPLQDANDNRLGRKIWRKEHEEEEENPRKHRTKMKDPNIVAGQGVIGKLAVVEDGEVAEVLDHFNIAAGRMFVP